MTQIEIVSADGFVAFSFGREVVASWENFQHILNCTSSGMFSEDGARVILSDVNGNELENFMFIHRLSSDPAWKEELEQPLYSRESGVLARLSGEETECIRAVPAALLLADYLGAQREVRLCCRVIAYYSQEHLVSSIILEMDSTGLCRAEKLIFSEGCFGVFGRVLLRQWEKIYDSIDSKQSGLLTAAATAEEKRSACINLKLSKLFTSAGLFSGTDSEKAVNDLFTLAEAATSLLVRGGRPNPKIVEMIGSRLFNCAHLRFEKVYLGQEGVVALARALEALKRPVDCLDVSRNGLTSASVRRLNDLIVSSSTPSPSVSPEDQGQSDEGHDVESDRRAAIALRRPSAPVPSGGPPLRPHPPAEERGEGAASGDGSPQRRRHFGGRSSAKKGGSFLPQVPSLRRSNVLPPSAAAPTGVSSTLPPQPSFQDGLIISSPRFSGPHVGAMLARLRYVNRQVQKEERSLERERSSEKLAVDVSRSQEEQSIRQRTAGDSAKATAIKGGPTRRNTGEFRREATPLSLSVPEAGMGDSTFIPLIEKIVMWNAGKCLTRLSLRENPIGEAGASSLAVALRANDTLQHLDVGDTVLGGQGLKMIAISLSSHPQIQEAILDRNALHNDSLGLGEALATMIEQSQTLKYLNISYTGMRKSNLGPVAKAMAVNPRLRRLDIAAADLGGSAMKDLSSSLALHNNLSVLNISWNRLPCLQLALVFESLASSRAPLRVVDASHNSFNVNVAVAVADLLLRKPTISVINLEGDDECERLGDDGACIIAGCLTMRPQSSDGQGSRNWNSRTSHQAAPLTVSVDIERTQRGNNGNSNANALFPAPASSLVAINMSNQKIGTVGGVSLCNALLTLQSIGAQSPSPTPSSNRSTTVIGTHLRYLGLRNNLISARGGTLLLRSFAPVEAREGSNCAEFDRPRFEVDLVDNPINDDANGPGPRINSSAKRLPSAFRHLFDDALRKLSLIGDRE